MVLEYGVLDRSVVYSSSEFTVGNILYYAFKNPNRELEPSNDLFERAANTKMYVIKDED